MPSPFPGMNPYLEQPDVWHDFHQRFVPYLAGLIGPQLAHHYVVKVDDQIYIREPSAEQRMFFGRGDAFVAERQPSAADGGGTAVAHVAAPAQIRLPAVDIERLSFLEIRDKRDRRVVTVIELLSPANKYSGADRVQYLGKRGHLLHSLTHLVEIDLLRGGPRMPFDEPLPECDYCVMVSRAEQRPEAGIWPLRLRDQLPKIPIPVRDPDPDATLDLQAALHHMYDEAGYANYIYEGSPEPRLSPEDAAWAESFIPRSA
jgi:hypothetical protein